jgi:hypothetical protein
MAKLGLEQTYILTIEDFECRAMIQDTDECVCVALDYNHPANERQSAMAFMWLEGVLKQFVGQKKSIVLHMSDSDELMVLNPNDWQDNGKIEDEV